MAKATRIDAAWAWRARTTFPAPMARDIMATQAMPMAKKTDWVSHRYWVT